MSDAKDLERDANRLTKAKPQAHGEGRAVGLRTIYVPVMDSYRDAAAWAYLNHAVALTGFLDDLAQKRVRAGDRAIPGFTIKEEKVV